MKLKFCTNYGNKKINKKLIVGGYSSSTVIYLIVGQNGVRYSTKSIQKIIKNSALKSGIYKKVTPHNLQYSFATHLLENRTDIRLIQTILGHSNIKITQIYTHVSNTHLKNIQNPSENLNFL